MPKYKFCKEYEHRYMDGSNYEYRIVTAEAEGNDLCELLDNCEIAVLHSRSCDAKFIPLGDLPKADYEDIKALLVKWWVLNK